jgi:predicted GTPase
MSYQQAQQEVQLLADGLEEIAGIMAEHLDLPDEAQKLVRRAQQVRDDCFRVVVVGEFKRGKSTLLNAMLGDLILPQKVTECTAVITLI